MIRQPRTQRKLLRINQLLIPKGFNVLKENSLTGNKSFFVIVILFIHTISTQDMTVVTSNVCKWAVYNLTLWKTESARGSSISYLNGFQKETQCTLNYESLAAETSDQIRFSNPKLEHWSESNRSPSSHKPGLNWILTPASFWIFLIISPFLPITIPTANLGTETWWERQSSMKAQRTSLNYSDFTRRCS